MTDAVVSSGPIRYASAGRFQLPVVASDPDAAAAGAAQCPQPASRLDAIMGPPNDTIADDEACLLLKVVRPRGQGPHPVMVFVHGGGFTSGAGLRGWYDGSALAAEQQVVVVSINYRLGPLGLLMIPGVSPGNLSLHDQVAALRWVHANIAGYGGDPANVTVFGQSAGSCSIGWLLEVPSARRLIRRAIMQSGCSLAFDQSADDLRAVGQFFADSLDGDPRSASTAALLDAADATDAHDPRPTSLLPALAPARGVDPLPAQASAPIDPEHLDVLLGWNHDDMTAFGRPIDSAAHDAALAEMHGRPYAELAARLSEAGVRTTGYRLDWRPAGSDFGATHCVELPLLLGDEAAWAGSPMLGSEPWSAIHRLGAQLRSVWATFARSGRVEGALAPDVPIAWVPGPEVSSLVR